MRDDEGRSSGQFLTFLHLNVRPRAIPDGAKIVLWMWLSRFES